MIDNKERKKLERYRRKRKEKKINERGRGMTNEGNLEQATQARVSEHDPKDSW